MQHAARTCNSLNSCPRVGCFVPDGLSWAADPNLQLGEALRELQLPEVAVGLLQAAAHVAPRGCHHLPGVGGGGAPRAAAQAALSQHQLLPGTVCQPTTMLPHSLGRQGTITGLEERS